MTDDHTTAIYGNALVIRARIVALLGEAPETDADLRLARFAERLLRVIAGKPDAETDAIMEEALEDHPEPWRYDMRAERLEVILEEGLRLVELMRDEQYASLPQEAHDAHDAHADADTNRARRRATVRTVLGLSAQDDLIDA